MKRRHLLRMIAVAARARGLSWDLVREGAEHEVWALDVRRITIPRHREINELTAHAINEGSRGGIRQATVGDVRPTYTVIAERNDGWWAIRVAELRGRVQSGQTP